MERAKPPPQTTQAPNSFTTDPFAQSILKRIAPALLEARAAELASFGAFCGGELDAQAAYSDRIHPPVWKAVPVDPAHPGTRRGAIFLNPRYDTCHQEVYARGFIAAGFGEAPTQLYAPLAQYLISQADISIGCPFAMTHPVALIVSRYAPEKVREKFLPELIRTDRQTKSGGTWATEKHSGSDVGQTETRAVPQGDGTAKLYGQKWFTSNAGSGLALATARPEGAERGAAEGAKGLGLYLVPSHVDADWQTPNAYEITHLKEKIGTRGLATGEAKLDGAHAFEIAPPPDGLRVMMEALACSRVHNAMAAAGVMRRALVEAFGWIATRETFGKPLIERPLIRQRVAEIAVAWMAGSLLAFEAARSFDIAWASEAPAARLWARIATALAKYKTAEQAVWCAQKALGLVGGNGYTEDYPTARLYRDSVVLTVWEGPEQIQALELLRLIAGKVPGSAVFIAKLDEIHGKLPEETMRREREQLQFLRQGMHEALSQLEAADDAAKEASAGSFLHKMADTLSYALLCEHAAWELKTSGETALLPVCEAFYTGTFTPKVFPAASADPLVENLDAILSTAFA
ncbi:acyl-CoA dehydrogenase family protein [Methyloligella sp. 2.7D]|uniref:acyl-CoA dehydrogenase family protein n=1 Tax=unclassified Methyloligella TaxID=2625955 RepID=UPI00157CD392|nr:acyl-CoA dehydrogenase family protein [Methyloligella sp. GL2]QKP76344.1 acyl-CoA dehydrogenase family protein [Methyloligella sp. GL2]